MISSRCQMIQESSRASWNQQRQRTDARCCVHFDHFVWGPPPWCKRMIKWSFRSFMPFMPHFAKDVSWWILSLQSLIFWSTTLPSHSRSLKLLPKNMASWQLWWSIWNWHLDFFVETSKRDWSRNWETVSFFERWCLVCTKVAHPQVRDVGSWVPRR